MKTLYVISAAALDDMRGRCLAGSVFALLAAHPAKVFASTAAWTAHLALLGIVRLAGHRQHRRWWTCCSASAGT